MSVSGLRPLRRALLAAAPAAALLLAGCSATLDPKSGENLIRKAVSDNNRGTVNSVSCPSGLSPKVGTAFACKVTLTTTDGATEKGTITVHVILGDKVAMSPSDWHMRLS